MALIVITVQDTENGAVVSLAAEPQLNLAEAPTTEAQKLAHVMLGALPMNAPQEEARSEVELLTAMSGVLDKAAALTAEIGGEPAPAATGHDPGVQFPM